MLDPARVVVREVAEVVASALEARRARTPLRTRAARRKRECGDERPHHGERCSIPQTPIPSSVGAAGSFGRGRIRNATCVPDSVIPAIGAGGGLASTIAP